jgi:hypothetical protein
MDSTFPDPLLCAQLYWLLIFEINTCACEDLLHSRQNPLAQRGGHFINQQLPDGSF